MREKPARRRTRKASVSSCVKRGSAAMVVSVAEMTGSARSVSMKRLCSTAIAHRGGSTALGPYDNLPGLKTVHKKTVVQRINPVWVNRVHAPASGGCVDGKVARFLGLEFPLAINADFEVKQSQRIVAVGLLVVGAHGHGGG